VAECPRPRTWRRFGHLTPVNARPPVIRGQWPAFPADIGCCRRASETCRARRAHPAQPTLDGRSYFKYTKRSEGIVLNSKHSCSTALIRLQVIARVVQEFKHIPSIWHRTHFSGTMSSGAAVVRFFVMDNTLTFFNITKRNPKIQLGHKWAKSYFSPSL
jgi:hypothetical protein